MAYLLVFKVKVRPSLFIPDSRQSHKIPSDFAQNNSAMRVSPFFHTAASVGVVIVTGTNSVKALNVESVEMCPIIIGLIIEHLTFVAGVIFRRTNVVLAKSPPLWDGYGNFN